jgi:hypothetical protein
MSHLACDTSIEARDTSPEGETGRRKLGKEAHGVSVKCTPRRYKKDERSMTSLFCKS